MPTKKTRPRGGKRNGAGRPKVDPALKIVTTTITLDPIRLAKLNALAAVHGSKGKAVSALLDSQK